jgi:hypothetical protein
VNNEQANVGKLVVGNKVKFQISNSKFQISSLIPAIGTKSLKVPFIGINFGIWNLQFGTWAFTKIQKNKLCKV